MSLRERGYRAVIAAALAAFLIGFAYLSFPGGGIPGMPACPFKSLTGLPCPLCGGTRAAHALLQGDLGRALYLNPLALPAVALFVFATLAMTYEAATGEPVANWPVVFHRFSRLLPVTLIILGLWWIPHLYLALRYTKTELIELRNPIAHTAYTHLPGQIRRLN